MEVGAKARCEETSAKGFRCVYEAGHFGAHVARGDGKQIQFAVIRSPAPLAPEREEA
jgi:hypothetical protein